MTPRLTLEFLQYISYVIVDIRDYVVPTSLFSELFHSTIEVLPFILPMGRRTHTCEFSSVDTDFIASVPIYIVKGPKHPFPYAGQLPVEPFSFFVSCLTTSFTWRPLLSYWRVAFLEYDVGQSKFTRRGMVAPHVVENHVFGTVTLMQ